MSEELDFLVKIVKQASKLITPDFVTKVKDERGDLVTDFDYEIERFLISKINKAYPEFEIISEELNNQEKECKNYFTIDPIDGTVNFANGLPLWGIQVACIKHGEPCASVIYLPALKELYYSSKNGAFLNGNPIHVNKLSPNMVLYNADQKYKSLKENLYYRREVFSSAVFFAWLASGKYGALIFSPDIHSWDLLPGLYLAETAGAYVLRDKKYIVVANSKRTAEYFSKIYE